MQAVYNLPESPIVKSIIDCFSLTRITDSKLSDLEI